MRLPKYKLTVAPDQAAYAVALGVDQRSSQLQSPSNLYFRNQLNNSNTVSVSWVCDETEYNYLAACDRAAKYNGGLSFYIDLMLGDVNVLTEYKARFVPDSFILNSVEGTTFYVACQLEIEAKPYDVVNKPYVVDSGLANRNIQAATGYFTLVGEGVVLHGPIQLPLDTAYFSLTGNSAILQKVKLFAADEGSFTLTGEDVSILASRYLGPTAGIFSLNGQDAPFVSSRLLTAAQASFALTGEDLISFVKSSGLVANVGNFVLTGEDLTSFLASRLLSAAQASFALTGNDAPFVSTKLISAVQASYLLTGNAATLTYTPVVAATDPNFDYLSFLLTGQDINDHGPNAYAGTLDGSATDSTTRPKWGTKSYEWPSSGSPRLHFTSYKATDINGGDCTVEAWVYPTALPTTNATIMSCFQTGGRSWAVLYGASGNVFFRGSADGSADDSIYPSGGANLTLNAWNHVAVVRINGSVTVYVNGTGGTAVADARAYFYTGQNSIANYFALGGEPDALWYMAGFTGEARVYVGKGIYTGTTLTVPTAAFPTTGPSYPHAGKFVRALLHGNGANNSTTISDTGLYRPTWTANGTAKISTAQSKFAGSSLLFDGTTNCNVTTPDASRIRSGNSDMCIEFFMRATSFPSGGSTLFTKRASTSAFAPWQIYMDGSGTLIMLWSKTGSTWDVNVSSATPISTATWYHIAMVRYGATVYMYINGVLKASSTAMGISPAYSNTAPLIVGGSDSGSSGLYGFVGHIAEFRYSIGDPVYTAAFTPPAAAFADITA